VHGTAEPGRLGLGASHHVELTAFGFDQGRVVLLIEGKVVDPLAVLRLVLRSRKELNAPGAWDY
jgi:hypothetical protein